MENIDWSVLSWEVVKMILHVYEVVLTYESEDEILKCGHWNEGYWAVLGFGAFYYAVQSGSNFWVSGWTLTLTIHMKAVVEYFPVFVY